GYEAHVALMERSLNCKEKIIRESWVEDNPIFKTSDYKRYTFNFLKKRIAKGISLKYLIRWGDIKLDQFNNINLTSDELKKEVRIKPWDFMEDIALRIFDDIVQLVTFNSGKEFKVITIRDIFVANLFKSFFDFVWIRSIAYFGKNILPEK